MNDGLDAPSEGSIVNFIGRQNLLSLRQKSADSYFDLKAKERLVASNDYKQTRIASTQHGESKSRKITKKKKETWTDPESGYEIALSAILNLKNEMILEFMILGEVSKKWKPPLGIDEKILPPRSQNEFADFAGISRHHYKCLEDGTANFTLDDAVKISRACDIDLSTFLTPSLENLETDIFLDLLPINPTIGPIYMYQWMMWIHGYKELPGQDPTTYREMTALPKPFVYKVHAGRERDYEIRQKELSRISESMFNASSVLGDAVPKKTSKKLTSPYLKLETQIPFEEKIGKDIIRSTRKIATAIKVVFRVDNGTVGLKRLDVRFTRAFGMARENIVYVVKLLLGLRK